jgi:predicted permease
MKLFRRLRFWWDRVRRADSLSEEMASHVAFRADDLMAEENGLTREDAEARARREFGNLTKVAEDSRSVWIARCWTDLVQDIRYTLRNLARQPGFTAAGVLSAGLGIAACAIVFSLANVALFRTPPIGQPERVAMITRGERNTPGDTMSYPFFREIRKQSRTLQSVSAYFPIVPASITAGGDPRRHFGWLVSANYFATIGVQPVLGRTFDPAKDDEPGATPAVVLAHHVWQSRFQSDPNILREPILFNGERVQVVGIAPPGFRGHEVALVADFWVPMSMLPKLAFGRNEHENRFGAADSNWVFLVGRMQEGAGLSALQSELRVIAENCKKQYPGNGDGDRQWSFSAESSGQIAPVLRNLLTRFFSLLLGITGLVLLIACANVANLLLARSASRRREIATRLSIGAGRGRLVRQLLTESLVLAGAGGVLGVALTAIAAAAIGKLRLPFPLPIDFTVPVDSHVLIFSVALSMITGVGFGLFPALRASRVDLHSAMRDEPDHIPGWRRFGVKNGLVVLQVAVSMILLIIAALFLRSLDSASHTVLGLDSRNILMAGVDPDLNGYAPEKAKELLARITKSIRSLPGVKNASYTNLVPLSLAGNSTSYRAKAGQDAERTIAQIAMIGPGYFDTMGIPILRGEDFGRESPQGERVVAINQLMADKLFPGEEALGRRVFDGGGTPHRVVAIIANSKSRSIGEEQRTQVYRPASQNYGTQEAIIGMTLLVKTAGGSDPVALAPAVRAEIQAADPTLAIFDVRTFDEHLHNAYILPRAAAFLFGLCGFMGLLIATIGLYGVISFLVARRTREVGIRMALGARPGEILRLILRSGMALALTGCTIGLALSLVAASAARSLLYGVSPMDPLTFVAVPLFLIAVALTACAIPAVRASRVNPIRTLRYE